MMMIFINLAIEIRTQIAQKLKRPITGNLQKYTAHNQQPLTLNIQWVWTRGYRRKSHLAPHHHYLVARNFHIYTRRTRNWESRAGDGVPVWRASRLATRTGRIPTDQYSLLYTRRSPPVCADWSFTVWGHCHHFRTAWQCLALPVCASPKISEKKRAFLNFNLMPRCILRCD